MFIRLADAEVYAVSFGDPAHPPDRTLVALGGWVGSWELWAEPFTHLSARWRTVAFDHRGSGATVADAASITFEALVADLFAVLDALAIPRCVLAGESSGAAVAVAAALAHPERFSGLVLVDGLVQRPALAATDPFLHGLRHDYQATLARFVDACVPEPDSAAIRRWGRQIVSRAPQDAAIRLYECLAGVDLRTRAGQIGHPTLLLHGTADALVPLDDARWLATHIPGSRLEILEGAGHVPTVTRPRAVAEAIERFFA